MRVSVTDRCNMRCVYCQPMEEEGKVNRENVLSYEEIVKLIKACNQLGINKVRLTGGEPLCRKDLRSLVSMIDRKTEVEDLSITTNGVLLEKKAQKLASAGLDRANISLDAMNREVFTRITRRDYLKRVLRGIVESKRAGLEPVKLNTVLMEGVNEEEIEGLIRFSVTNDLILRFIELMPMGKVEHTELEGLSKDKIKEILTDKGFKLSDADKPEGQGPANYFRVERGKLKGRIGFIFPFEKGFCSDCNKLRVTSRGKIRPCLAHDLEYDLCIVKNKKLSEVKDIVSQAILDKPFSHHWKRGSSTKGEMSKIGG